MKMVPAVILAVIVLSCSGAEAAPGDISAKTSLSVSAPTGVAWTGTSMWIADRMSDSFIEVDLDDGGTLRRLSSPGYFPSGLAWDGRLLWSTDPSAGKIYATDTETGMTVRTLDSPTPSPTGIAWNGGDLWICDNRSDRILRIDPGDGTTIVSFPSPATDPRGITFGLGYLWCSDRVRDCIYMLCPRTGMVIMILDAPGPFSWGLTWKDGMLINSDYQHDALYEVIARDDDLYKTYNPRKAVVTFTTEAVAMGPGRLESLDIFYADPVDRVNQRLTSPTRYSPDPLFEEDRWGQRIAHFHFESIESGSSVEVSLVSAVETSAIRFFIFPDLVGTKIPADIKGRYLEDDIKFDLEHPYIQKIVREAAGEEKNLYWRARKLYQYLIENMEYQLSGGWNTAPTVLERRNGSCSEYSFSYIALCRAAGIPARYVGALVVRGDDASYDDVFHRWNEIYLPGYGWVPVDANAGDRELPADQGAAFGGISNRFLVTTEGGGNSEYLGWSYNHENRWVSSGKCSVKFEAIAEWEPVEDASAAELFEPIGCKKD